jgi:flagellar motor switch protein FliM
VGDILAAAPDSSLWARFSDVAGGGPTLIIVEGQLLAALIGRLFGAEDGEAPRPIGGEPTEVERAVGARLCRELIDAIRGCWIGSAPPQLLQGEVAPSARVVEDLDPGDVYLVTELILGAPEEPLGALKVALPMTFMRGVAPSRPQKPPPAPPAPKMLRYDRVFPIEVDLVVELTRVTVPLGRLRTLAVGDELSLSSLGDAFGRVGDRKALAGEAGVRDGVRSFRVIRRLSSSNLEADDR